LDAAAADLLSATAPLRVRFGPWDAGLGASMAREATAGWPAHLSPRWILSVFAGTELSRAESLPPVRLPVVLGATSFARALAVFGEAFAESAASTAAPFAMMRAPIDLRPMRVAALTASLAADPVVARRVLDLGPSAARDHARLFARAAAANVRLAAAASRARRSFFPLADDLDDRFCEETASAWGEPLPPELAGLVPRIDETTPARFAALLLAANDRAQMIERFDEDWYRNPRSAEALRALATEPLAPIPEAALRRGAADLARQLLDLAT
ncbi:MAG: hypothetical protein R3F14_46580, partial [Polyangiaceae bacterium]